MQRGRPSNKCIDEYPSNQYIYSIICKEINLIKEKQKQVKQKRYPMRKQQIAIEHELTRMEIELDILLRLKANIENPDYFDEVCDGAD